MNDAEYRDGPFQNYDCGEDTGTAVFVRVCEKCGRFVKADETVLVGRDAGLSKELNATCSRCGRTHMLFMGFF